MPTDNLGGEAADASKQVERTREEKSAEYRKQIRERLGLPALDFRYQDGVDYTRVWEDVIVGSCLQGAADVDWLVEREGVTLIACLQEESDFRWWGIDATAIKNRCASRGDVKHLHCPIKDFDPKCLREALPKVVPALAREHEQARGTIYIHCTAGLHRAPSTALAYMHWCRGWNLKDAYTHLLSLRRCGPRISAIREATAHILYGIAQQRGQETVQVPRTTNVDEAPRDGDPAAAIRCLLSEDGTMTAEEKRRIAQAMKALQG